MHTRSRRAALTLVVSLLVTACNCTSSQREGDGPIAVTFAESSARGVTYVGQPTPMEMPLHVSLGRAPSGTLTFGLAGAETALQPAVRVETASDTSYVLYLSPRTDVAQGAHAGTLTLLLCADDACSKTHSATGNTLPFEVNVDAALSVTVKVGGAQRATAGVASPASVDVLSRDAIELDANAPMSWTYPTETDGVQVSVASDSAAAAWKGTVTLPWGADAASLILTGTAQDGSDSTVQVTLPTSRAAIAGTYATGVYPNLFHDVLGVDEADVQNKIDAVWSLYFDPSSTTPLFFEVGADMGYVEDIYNNDIRSEGMSYAMMIAVQLDHQDVFDKLWRFTKTYLLRSEPADPWLGYFAWHVSPTGPDYAKLSVSNASDGEEWFATALFMASNRWGDEGALNYQADAQAILHTMLHTEDRPAEDRIYTVASGPRTVTNMFNADNYQVVFVANSATNSFTDPSYHLPHFYDLWAAWADEDKDFWCRAAAASRAFLPTTVDDTTGLAPDYAQFDGTAYGPTNAPEHANFQYDAFRVGANVGVDHLWFQRDPWQVAEADRLLGFFHSHGSGYASLWTLSGTALNSGHGAGLTGTNAALAIASSDANLRSEFLQALWNASAPTQTGSRYYDGLLYTLALLQVSGNFRVYHPSGVPATTCP